MISDNDCHDADDDDAVDVLSMMMFRSMLHGDVVVGVVVWMERWSDGRYEGGLTEIIEPLTVVREQQQRTTYTTSHSGSGTTTTTTITRFEKPEPTFLFAEVCMQMLCSLMHAAEGCIRCASPIIDSTPRPEARREYTVFYWHIRWSIPF